MAFTYTDTLTTNRDKVRFLTGDTDSTDVLLTDGEITFTLTEESDVYRAASLACRRIVAKLCRKADFSNGANSVSASQRVAHYAALADQLDLDAVRRAGTDAFAGGLTVSGKKTLNEDDDAVQPGFKINDDRLLDSYGDWTDVDRARN